MHSELLLREFLCARIAKTRERQGRKLAFDDMNQVVDRSSFTSFWNLESHGTFLQHHTMQLGLALAGPLPARSSPEVPWN